MSCRAHAQAVSEWPCDLCRLASPKTITGQNEKGEKKENKANSIKGKKEKKVIVRLVCACGEHGFSKAVVTVPQIDAPHT